MSLTQHARKVALFIAGTILLLVGLAMSIPGVPGPGMLLLFWGFCLLGMEGLFLAAVTWCFTLVGLSGLGAFIVRWLRKASFKGQEHFTKKPGDQE